MSTATAKNTTVKGITAEFDSVDTLLDACRRVRDAGYTKTDAFTPFPVHGIDRALGIQPTKLPWIALAGGVIGCLSGLAMEIWMNGIDYQYIISGKPFVSLPAFIPVSFELTILLASFGAFFGMLALNGLPKFSNPLFTNPRFDRSTDDRFFLFIDASDEHFSAEGVRTLLGDCGSSHVEDVVEDSTSEIVPRPIFYVLTAAAIVALIPPILIARMRVTTSGSPRFHVFYDMDFSPAKDAQTTTTLFADGRSMRPDVPGTVARGQLEQGLDFNTGIDMDALARIDPDGNLDEQFVAALQPPAGEAEPQVETEPTESAEGEQPPAESETEEQEPTEKPAGESEGGSQEKTEPTAETAKGEAPAGEPKSAEDDKPAEGAKSSEGEKSAGDKQEAPAEAMKPEPDDGDGQAEAAATAEEGAEATPDGEKPVEEMNEAEPAPQEGEQSAGEGAGRPEADAAETEGTKIPWLKENPLPLTMENLERGRLQFNIYCAVCHGKDGSGRGMVARRAQRILSPTWVPPTRLYNIDLYSDQYPDGKLFNTITHGIRKMPGYGAQITARDRWAIVSYVRALQQSRNADSLGEDVVPAEEQETIERLRREVEQKLQREAEQAAAGKSAAKLPAGERAERDS